MEKKGNIINIQRFTLHDGPGIRTELFLKGCPLHCNWCSNPESLKSYTQPGVFSTKCISVDKCGSCLEVCHDPEMLIFEDGILKEINRDKCTNCLKCYDTCPADAIKKWGNLKSVSECMNVIRKDIGFYRRSGGGVSVSGGEPLIQSDFVLELFKACQNESIHTCVESCLHVKYEEIAKVLPYGNLIIADIKHMDTQKHKEYTGVGNELILENLKLLAKEDTPIILRIPIIPGVNDDMDNIKQTADFILNKMGNNVRTLQLLSFMRLGEEKYKSLGMPYLMKDLVFDRDIFQLQISMIAKYFNSRGIHTLVGTKEKE